MKLSPVLFGISLDNMSGRMKVKTKLTLQQFIDRANIVHNYKYDYSAFVYVNAHTKGVIKCKIHGDFCQTPHNHCWYRQGCPVCGGTMKKRFNNF